ncbi:hypothetical protein Syn7502_01000 [Synechococcus sp. PCC 7502]|uniref:hypothetical protein n=1 Tax=Synechococcus sp. PCC 7502 TaxID=1173263 RepID=UPI00029FBF2C|nr:hypothetical protein [Synechococcus sp. PCC 7502]AFY73115.1 hypothetical protein Syn7502_01000 [Synechococcus sp. PCC 7502]
MSNQIWTATGIQMIYPEVPEWQDVSDHVLIELIENYQDEPSCATSAILELSLRQPEVAKNLAHWLILENDADKWLKSAALDVITYLLH